MKKAIVFLALNLIIVNTIYAQEVLVTNQNLASYSLSEQFSCNPGGTFQHYGFKTTLQLKDGNTVQAITCMDGPIGFRSARSITIKNLSRILNNEISFEKNTSQIVCFKTFGIIDVATSVLVFDTKLVKCI